MSVLSRPRLVSGAACLLVLAGCGAAEKPSLDERVEDLDAAVELYKSVDGAECDEPSEPNEEENTIAVRCEDGAVVVWSDRDSDDDVRELMAAMLSDDGTDAVVGVNVTIMNVDRADVASQIGGIHV